MTRPAIDRFMEKVAVDPDTGCWLWTASVTPDGYGTFSDGGTRRAHRWSYEHHVGDVLPGLQLDHLCRVRRCVNPAHLEPVTPRENIRRSTNRVAKQMAATHCPAGHEYTSDNIRYRIGRSGPQRKCRACGRLRARARYAARKVNT